MPMRLALSGVVAVALVLTGCGSDGDPKADGPTSSPSPTAPPGLDANPPEKPAGQADTPASAVEYAGWFAHLVQYAIETRDARPVNDEAFDQASCTTCRELATFIADLESGGYWQLSDDLDLGKLRSRPTGDGIRVSGAFVYPELQDVKVDGTVEKTIPAAPYRYSVDLTWDDSDASWRVVDYTFERKSA